MASEWAEMYTSALAQGEGFSRTQKEMIANALDSTRYRFLREGRREGMEEAAKVADDRRKLYAGLISRIDRTVGSMCGLIAADIRALIDKDLA